MFKHHVAACLIKVLTFLGIKISRDVTLCLLINTVWLNMWEELNVHQHCCDNLKSRTVHLCWWVLSIPRTAVHFVRYPHLQVSCPLPGEECRYKTHTHTHTHTQGDIRSSDKAHHSSFRPSRAKPGGTAFATLPIYCNRAPCVLVQCTTVSVWFLLPLLKQM
jgi:hypothetical protein